MLKHGKRHFVHEGYLKAWARSRGSGHVCWVYRKNIGDWREPNINGVMSQTRLHSQPWEDWFTKVELAYADVFQRAVDPACIIDA
jgi:hypothetical protein